MYSKVSQQMKNKEVYSSSSSRGKERKQRSPGLLNYRQQLSFSWDRNDGKRHNHIISCGWVQLLRLVQHHQRSTSVSDSTTMFPSIPYLLQALSQSPDSSAKAASFCRWVCVGGSIHRAEWLSFRAKTCIVMQFYQRSRSPRNQVHGMV